MPGQNPRQTAHPFVVQIMWLPGQQHGHHAFARADCGSWADLTDAGSAASRRRHAAPCCARRRWPGAQGSSRDESESTAALATPAHLQRLAGYVHAAVTGPLCSSRPSMRCRSWPAKGRLDQIKLLQRTRINSDFGTIANLTETQMPGPQVAMPVIQRIAGDYFETMLAEHRRQQLARLIGILGVHSSIRSPVLTADAISVSSRQPA